MVYNLKHPEKEVTIALVGKYTALHDAYISVVEALKHGAVAHNASVTIKWISSEDVTVEIIVYFIAMSMAFMNRFFFINLIGFACLFRFNMLENIICHFLDYALVCRWPLWNLHAILFIFMMPIV